MHKLCLCRSRLYLMLLLTLTACAPISADAVLRQPAAAAVVAVAAAPRTLNVLVGAGQDTIGVNAFLPAALRVRVGDTVTWNLASDEIHTVSFLGGQPLPVGLVPAPDTENDLMEAPAMAFPTRAQDAPIEHYDGTTYVNSGILDATPDDPNAVTPNTSFSLTFDKPGLYPFLCQIHPWYMRGVVAVEAATADDLPAQDAIDAQISAERELLTGVLTTIEEAGQTPRSDTLADGTHLWYVNAGANNVGDGTTNLYAFMAQELTINVGDTVVWSSNDFHTVTFAPLPPDPFYVEFRPQADGPSLRVLNPIVLAPAKPSQVYNPTQYYNSGFIGPAMPDGSTWSLTFDQPGTYPYRCAVHGDFGMIGTIIVK